jgi:ATP-binding protein involved in chromosome partitioning
MKRDPRVIAEEVGPTEDGQKLRIRWADAVVSEYFPRDLRLACPCAGCVDETTGLRTLQASHVGPDIYPTAIHYVGRYALQFILNDTATTEIYTWELLREIAESDPAQP